MNYSSNPILHLGRNNFGSGQEFNVDLTTLENMFFLLLGKSGAGKSHTIRKIMDQIFGYASSPITETGKPTFHVLGYHPDFSYEDFASSGATDNITSEDINILNFDYTEGNTATNILQPLKNSEALRFRTTEDFIGFCRIAHPGIGLHQQKYLRDILEHTYEHIARTEGRYPDLADLYDEVLLIKKSLSTGLNSSVIRNMKKLRREKNALDKILKSNNSTEDQKRKAQTEAEANEFALIDEVTALIKTDSAWVKNEYYADFDLKTLQTLDPLISELIRPQFFTRKSGQHANARPMPGAINFYDIHMLEERHMDLMTHVLLSRIYHGCVIKTKKEHMNPSVAHTYIVGDELRYLASASDKKTSPANLIFGGGRKFGIGMIVGGQGADQLSEDMARAFSLKIILAQNEAAYKDTHKYFRIKEAMVTQIVAKQSAIIKHGAVTELVNLFR